MSEPRVALVAGASRSIGRRIVERYLSSGETFRVAGCSRTPSDISNPGYKHFIADIADENSVKLMFADIHREYGRLDILINCAGLQSIGGALLTSDDTLRKILDVNVRGAFLLCREASKLMKINRYGRIVNFSSAAVPLCSAGSAVYGASKAAVEQFTKVLAKEIYGYGITANVLRLSIVAESGMAANISPAATEETLKKTVTGKLINFTDICEAVDFMISEKSGQLTAQTIGLGGI
ncbi:MAG: oxidoreductase [Elusimicrobia bacterium HGW-Elusimicrobia-1]|jgi:3-oxoacyl-[acyl-carrier protein] reductase|nr:MAG: oxidoreductase [Elusimicrobia bacterium HGW-Elusimicrobia-1]